MRIIDPATWEIYCEKRRQRIDEPGDAREFTFCCYRRFSFLGKDRTRNWLIDAMNSARQKYPFDIWAYVLMPDHAHLLLFPREPGLKMGPIVGEIKEVVGRKGVAYIRKHSPEWLPKITVREGKRERHRFWQPGGGFDRNANQIKTLHYMIDYIHANPVRRGLVTRPEDWHWSSAQWYAGVEQVPIAMDRTVPMRHLND
jgi:putative transposase